MTDAYEVFQDAGLRKAYDVWDSYLAASTGEDPNTRETLRSLLESAREYGEFTWAQTKLAEMYDEARKAGLTCAPPPPRPAEEDRQVRDYAKDLLRGSLPLRLLDRLNSIHISLRVLNRRFHDAPDLDTATREDVLYITARAESALDLAHADAAKRELERLKTLARRCGVKD
ncbi:hypothetical protein [Streptomyces acidiscabies]|uniref:Uncharacterized protein n=1 Tax=Streptomyces acidiscabies TaxID=42234 RepID=A0A0L0KPL0_9ACTN|nr:hypothetical protein [Streptomyces acidiscabies]KND40117.1 hypothetical protein IQ63_00820 [Streptomyces acidiscabies]